MATEGVFLSLPVLSLLRFEEVSIVGEVVVMKLVSIVRVIVFELKLDCAAQLDVITVSVMRLVSLGDGNIV